jgi:predicted patatin/cPLA2 family phospholipase
MDTIPEQLDLFEEKSDLALLQTELQNLRRQCGQWQRSMTAKYHQLSKLCLHLQQENSLQQQRIQMLEKLLREQGDSTPQTNDDYLAKLFAAAYLASN